MLVSRYLTLASTRYTITDKESRGSTLVSEKMRQTAVLVNAVYNYQTQFEILISDRYPESTFTIFDVYSLVREESLPRYLLTISFKLT